MTMTMMMMNIYWQKNKKNATGNQNRNASLFCPRKNHTQTSYDDDDDGLRVAVLLDGLGWSGRSVGGTARGATKSQLCHSSGEQ